MVNQAPVDDMIVAIETTPQFTAIRELENAYEQLRLSNGMVSHELKTPLTSMMACQHLLQKNEGMGIGLYLSKEIIERHNGKILVESESGKGSTFTFSLPVSS